MKTWDAEFDKDFVVKQNCDKTDVQNVHRANVAFGFIAGKMVKWIHFPECQHKARAFNGNSSLRKEEVAQSLQTAEMFAVLIKIRLHVLTRRPNDCFCMTQLFGCFLSKLMLRA